MTKDRWIANLERRANEYLIRADIAHAEGDYKLQLEECQRAEECFNLRDTLLQPDGVNSNQQEKLQ